MVLIFCENNHLENAAMGLMRFKYWFMEQGIKGKVGKGIGKIRESGVLEDLIAVNTL